MITDNSKLNQKVFDADVEKKPIRFGYGDGLLEVGGKNQQIVALCADLTESTRTKQFKDAFPERFIEMGVAEQSMASVASGMAAMGKIPFIASYAMFSPGRNWEQIRTTICYNNVNVKIVGAHAGVSVGPDGGTHQAIEDIAITRVIPRMTVVVPADACEAKKATIQSVDVNGPVYIRLGREKTPVVTTEESPFEIGKANVIWKGENPQISLIACGQMVYRALVVAKRLSEENINSIVINLHTIKPIDKETIISAARLSGRVLTLEEHQVAGGMGSAVAEVLAKEYPAKMDFVGVDDKFGQSGEPDELMEYYGMGVEAIYKKAKDLIQKTN